MITDFLHWLIGPFDTLTAHQLDALRTIAQCVGGGLVPIVAFLLGWGIKLLRKVRTDGEATRRNTAVGERVGGEVREVGVAEIARDGAEHARHAVASGEATLQEISDLGGWIHGRGTGTRRQPTGTVPSIYAGEAHEPR